MKARAAVPSSRARASRRHGIALWIGGTALILALSVGGVAFTPTTMPVALWWPAAGVSACLVLLAPARARPWALAVIFATTALGNLIGGREPTLSAAFGAANALEIALFVGILLRGRRDARLRTTTDSLRLAVAAAIASSAFGLLAGIIGAVTGRADFGATALLTTGSHLSAILLITPLVLLPRRHVAAPGVGEITAQIIVTITTIAVGFGVFVELRLSFLVFLPLIWATQRFSSRFAHIEALLIAAAILLLTRLTWPADAGIMVAVSLVGLLCAIAIFTVFTAVERSESLANAHRAVDAANARAAAARATAETLRVRYDLDRQREDFLSTTSHELRTPVTIIAGYTDLLREHDDLPAETDPWVHAIHRNTARLAGMLDDLLAFSRSQAAPAAGADIAASTLVTAVVDLHADDAARRGVGLTIARMPGLSLHADPIHARRALSSLVSNAVKFTPTGGRVHVDAAAVGDDVMITVADSGPGMSDETLAQAFEPFYRGEQSEARAMPGTGLGLAIARMLARRNGGEVTIVSRPGQGTRATLLLRRAGAAGPGLPAPADADADADDATRGAPS